MTNALPGPAFKRRSAIAQAAEAEKPAAPPIAAVAPPSPTPAPRNRRSEQDIPEAPPQVRNKRISGESKDILLSMPEDEKARMVNTIVHTAPRTGLKHQSRFMRYAIAKLCQELEDKFNNGEPFEPPAVEPI